MSLLTEIAPAKINLSLHVGPVKPNGRHDLKSLVAFAGAPAQDMVEARPASHTSLNLRGPNGNKCGPAKTNLVLTAARILDDAADSALPPLAFVLQKHLPVAAGIGGGSANAAAALRLMVKSHGGDLIESLAKAIAPDIGGDVLACLYSLPGIMSGEGDRFAPRPNLPALPALLVTPNTPCPTGPVFAKFDQEAVARELPDHPDFDTPYTPIKLIDALKEQTTNDLAGPAISLVPEIAIALDLIAAQPGARLSRMSGSGATCFGLFEDIREAAAAEARIAEKYPDWWTVSTMLGGN